MNTRASRVIPKLALVLTAAAGVAGLPGRVVAQENTLPVYLRDRGTGLPTSMSETYIDGGQLLIYPSFTYQLDNNREYQPDQFGVGPDVDFRGKYWSAEGVIFIGYGLTDWFALELETNFIHASFEKSPSDSFATPAKLTESGVGDIEGQARLRFLKEGGHRPEIFSYLEVTAPSSKDKMLIGEADWDFRPGLGLIKGFSWGTLSLRTTVEYNKGEKKWDLGETAIGYLKRLSPFWRVYLGIEGGEGGPLDEWHQLSDVEYRLNDSLSLKFNNTFGISSKANDWTPEVGLLISFPR